MLDEYRIEPMTVGQYLDEVDNENIKINQAVQRDFCWKQEMMNALIYSALSRRIYIPTIILAEEKKKNGTKQTYVVDGGQRTETLYRFKFEGYKITKNLRNYLIPYNKKKVDSNGEYVRDEYGNIESEIEMFDIRNKTYEDLPDELKSKFNGCALTASIYQDCTPEETSELVLLYNNHVGMNVSQKSLTYIGRYAEEIKRIKDNNRFLKDCTALTENEKVKGFWERVISESVMAVKHFENWKKTPKDMCDYLNNNSSIEEYKEIEEYFNRIAPYSDKIDNKEISELFTSKNMFVWMMLFDRFDKLHISDERFGDFLQAFVSGLCKKEINGENWIKIDADKHTKDRSVITKKVNHLEELMNEFLHINNEETVTKTDVAIEEDKTDEDGVEVYISEITGIDEKVLHENIDIYIDMLEGENGFKDVCIRDDSRLLNRDNSLSLLAMVAYAESKEENLDEWLTEYAKNNDEYLFDQKENFLHMKKSFDEYLQKGAVA